MLFRNGSEDLGNKLRDSSVGEGSSFYYEILRKLWLVELEFSYVCRRNEYI